MTPDWNARQYALFEAERTRPALDLLARIGEADRRFIVDLGCGPGNSTQILRTRFPKGNILGLDSSPDMIAAAKLRLPDCQFELADIARWRSQGLDLIFANAVLQWVPDHIAVMRRLIAMLGPSGCLAVQMPDNLAEPSHEMMRKVALRPPFANKLAAAAAERETLPGFERYHDALELSGADVTVWRTNYVHRLQGDGAIVEWLKATGLRPFLAPLTEPERHRFIDLYRQELKIAYPARSDGFVLLPFPRLFIVAHNRR